MTIAIKNSVFAIVLAAGSATRFGSTKQVSTMEGEPLVRRAIQLAASACGTKNVLLAGHDWRTVSDACRPLPGFLVINDRHAEGLGSSIALAVRSVRHVASAVVVLLADQVMITQQHVESLIDRWSGDPNEIVATSYAETVGAPTLFPAGCFDALLALRGDQGGRAILDDPLFAVREIAFEDAAVDVDTVEDLARISRNAHS